MCIRDRVCSVYSFANEVNQIIEKVKKQKSNNNNKIVRKIQNKIKNSITAKTDKINTLIAINKLQ